MTLFETLSLIVMGTGVLVALISAVIALRNLKIIVKAHADNHEWSRRIATQDAIAKLRELNIEPLINRELGYHETLTSIPLKAIQAKFKANPDLQVLCHKLLNFNEGLASGVHLGIYDELTIKINRKGAIERDFIRLREYIIHRRDERSHRAWIEQERLISKWREEELEKSNREATGKI